ncbi:helix-turn-helix domain-containing protein [Desulfosarcina sp. OttesenSCG-928-B08]|nr:helix-turn-helix domain-containing protein [Desulfosarcina sp. OttesenSCG-928-B08]
MHHAEVAYAHIQIPAECLPLVTELVTRLGGKIVDGEGRCFPVSPMPEIERGGKMLKALRLRAGMTQKEVADAIGVPQSHISDFEQNHCAVPYVHAQKLAEILRSIPSHVMTPDAETLAAMREEEKEDERSFSSANALFQDLEI